MEQDNYDLIVAGAGPAGSVAAAYASKAGLKTLLIDKAHFPRDKSCGDAVLGRSVDVLRDLGIEGELAERSVARVRAQVFYSYKGDAVRLGFRPSASGDGSGYVVPRLIFDEFLFRHAQKQPKVTTLEDFSVTDVLWEGNQVVGVTGHGNSHGPRDLRGKIVLGADGAMSQVADKVGAYDFSKRDPRHWIGAFRIYYDDIGGLTNDIEIHFIDQLYPGYLWIFPAGNGLANVGAGMLMTHLRGDGPDKHKINIRQLTYQLLRSDNRFAHRFVGATERPGTFRGWQLPCGSERRPLVGNGWMLLGDAGGLIDPFSGEGIHHAMTSGRFAAAAAAQALGKGQMNSVALRPYEERIWRELGPSLKTSHRLQRRAHNRALVNFLLGRASRKPKVRHLLEQMAGDPEKAAQLDQAGFYLKLLWT